MTDKEIYQLIEEYKEESEALYERIHEQVESSIVMHAQAKKKRKKIWTRALSFATAFVLIVSLAIVLPIVLQRGSEEEMVRYSDVEVLKYERMGSNLKDYYALNNLSLLFLDRYDYAEDRTTLRYYEEGKESKTVYLYESFIDVEMGCSFQLSVMRRNIVIDALEEKLDEYEKDKVGNTEIIYRLNSKFSIAKFEYKGYKYYLELDDEVEKEFLVELISSMINTNNTTSYWE